MNHSEQINEITSALSKAQSEIRPAVEDKVNPHFKSSFASLNSIWNTCREPLSKNGLAIMQVVESIGENMFLVTLLSHSSGQWVKSTMPINSVKATMQAIGSSITYARRYSLAALIGISFGDDAEDDGNLSMGKPKVNSYVRSAEVDEFIKSNPEKFEYAKLIIKNSGKPEGEVISQILNNLERFNEAYEKWKTEQINEKDV